MGAILGFFALGMLGWWLITLGCFVWIIWSVEKDSWSGSLTCAILYILFLQFLGRLDLFGGVIGHPIDSVLDVLAYFVIGFWWSFVKWWLYVNKIAIKRSDARKEFLANYKEPKSAVPSETRDKYHVAPIASTKRDDDWGFIVRNYSLEKPTVSKNKNKISIWIIYWPVSLLWSLLDDLVKKIIKHLVIYFRKVYDGITNSAFKNID
jgi:hypothetical protein